MLLQEIRARQALMEIGKSEYHLDIQHSTPITKIDGVEYSLVFPKILLEYNKDAIKDIDTLFIGLITEKRKPFLSITTVTTLRVLKKSVHKLCLIQRVFRL